MNNTYIFDFDGVIVDSMPTWEKIMVEILDEYNVKYPDNIVEIITPLGMQRTGEYFVSLGMKDKTPEEVLKIIFKKITYAYENSINLKPYVKETLERLKKEGASLNILTASAHKVIGPCLKRNGAFELFDNIWSCDDFNMSKGETPIYFEVTKLLGKDVSECIFFDDNINNVEAAKKAGLFVYGVYDDTSKNSQDEIKEKADKYILDFSQI